MSSAAQFIHRLHDEEIKRLDSLRRKRRERTETTTGNHSIGERVADWVAAEDREFIKDIESRERP